MYYRNYHRVYEQICRDEDLCNSLIGVSREELIQSGMEEESEDVILWTCFLLFILIELSGEDSELTHIIL